MKEYLSKAIDLIKETIEFWSSSECEKLKKEYGIDSFYKDFGCIHLKFPRQSGHTTLAIKILENYENAYMITFNDRQKNNVIRMNPGIASRVFGASEHYSVNKLNKAWGECIAVFDNAEYLEHHERLYLEGKGAGVKGFICLQ